MKPKPSWLFIILSQATPHILLVPKKPYATLLDVLPDDVQFMHDLLVTVQSLIQEFELEQQSYRLITNGGAYQDVPHLHFHLVAEE